MSDHGTLRDEIRQTRPFQSLGQEVFLGVLRTADVLRHEASQALAGSGITLQQYNVLRILRGAGETGLPTLTIAERMIERTPGITRLLDRLEKKGLVARERSSGDRRCVLCRIAPAGLELLERLDQPVDKTDDEVVRALDNAQARELIALLDRIREHFARR